jgi:hypothetical protein
MFSWTVAEALALRPRRRVLRRVAMVNECATESGYYAKSKSKK